MLKRTMLNVTLGTDVAANSRSRDVAYWHFSDMALVLDDVSSPGEAEVIARSEHFAF
jgi:hypothetical protein